MSELTGNQFGGAAGTFVHHHRMRGKGIRVAKRAEKLVASTVSSAFFVRSRDLSAPTRSGARVARARQVAMYLAHVGLGLSYTDAGRLFGRDRTTAAHACRQIEEQRDDPRFDASLEYLEQALKARLAGAPGAIHL